MQEKKPREAEREWRDAVRLEPANLQGWQLLGDYYQATQNWSAAVDAFARIVQIDGKAPQAQRNLALAALQNDDVATAKQHAQIALQQNANDIAAIKALADIAQREKNNKERSKYLQQLATLQPQDTEILTMLAPILLTENDYAQAQKVAEQLLHLNPDSSVAYRVRGIARFTQDPSAQGLALAKADFEKALQLNPDDYEAHRYLGRIYMRKNQPLPAIAQFEAVGRGRPYALAHFMELAAAYRKAGRTRESEALMTRFSRVDNFNAQLRDLSGRFQRKGDKFESALTLVELLLQSVKENGDTYQLFAYRYQEKKVAAADFYLRAALELQPQNARAKAAMNELNALHRKYLQDAEDALKKRDFASADNALSHALLLHPEDARTQEIAQQLAQQSAANNPLLPIQQ